MSVRRIRTVAIACGLLLALSAAAIGRAQPVTPARPEEQSAPGMMGPGMMGSGMMGSGMMRGPMTMMGDMSQMMQACTQMMNQMMGATAPPAQPSPETK